MQQARRFVADSGIRPGRVLPDVPFEEWLDCDDPRGAFKPAMRSRPGQTAQYALALSRDAEDPNAPPLRFRFGLVASSDIHTARAGSGYKQVHRVGMSDVRGIASPRADRWLRRLTMESPEDPGQPVAIRREPMGFANLLGVERTASFLYPGGLVAAHAHDASREALWAALTRREVYGTSGPRILLWFDLLNGPAGRVPMGGATEIDRTPTFEVRALGAQIQRPGCPASTRERLSSERVAALCLDECHYPDDERHPIQAIEIVRIRPQRSAGEPIAPLIEDPWRRYPCPADPAGCVVRFEDPDFMESGRDAVYYARALQTPTAAINGANLRTRFDTAGNATSVAPCYAGHRGDPEDDCLAPVSERAWSSPIFVDASASVTGAR